MEEGVQMKGIQKFILVRLPNEQVSSGNITLPGGVEIKAEYIRKKAGNLLPDDKFLPNGAIYEVDPGVYVYAPTILGYTPGEKIIPSYLASGQLFYFLPVAIKGDNYIGYYASEIHLMG